MRTILFKERLSEKERRSLDMLEAIRKAGRISRSDISKITGFNIVTVSNYLNEYIKKGLVFESGLDVSTGGRKPELVELNPKCGYTIGIDYGPVHITDEAYMDAVLIDVTAKIIAKAKVKKVIEDSARPEEKVIALVKDIIKKSGVEKKNIYTIGIGMGGVLDRYKGTVRVPVMDGAVINYFAIQETLEREFGISSIIENDANAAALGERWAGLGLEAGIDNMVYICSDSGAGLIIKGELYPGSSNVAGELNLNPPVAGEENRPCWAGYDYGCILRSRGIDLGLAERARAYFSQHKDAKSKILDLVKGNLDKITFGTIIEASRAQDGTAISFLEEAGDYLGTKVAFLINVLNPDIVVIGRGIERAGETLLNAMRRSIDRWAFKEALKVVKVVSTSLGEDSVALGAAALAMQAAFVEML